MAREVYTSAKLRFGGLIRLALLVFICFLGALAFAIFENRGGDIDNDTWSPVIPERGAYQNEHLSGGDEEPATYTVRFFSGLKNTGGQRLEVTYGEQYGALPEAEKPGYTFLGWFTERIGGRKIDQGSIADMDSNIRLYARWDKTSPGVDKSAHGLPILMYHQFYDPAKGETPKKGLEANWMTVYNFEAQIKYLKEAGYYFPSWDEVYAYVKGQIPLPAKSVVITIDDGQSSFYEYAIPILKKYEVRATGFIITEKIEESVAAEYKDDPIISLQSHSHAMHKGGRGGKGLLLSIAPEDALADLKMSQAILGTHDAFAYPFGHHDKASEEIVESAGFRMAFTTSNGRIYPGMDTPALPRVRISANLSLDAFEHLVR